MQKAKLDIMKAISGSFLRRLLLTAEEKLSRSDRGKPKAKKILD